MQRIPDGETGDRQNWIVFQLEKFWQTPGLEQAAADPRWEGSGQMPRVRLADGVEPDAVDWPSLGYADVYRESYATFDRLRDEGVIPAGVRFQAQFPTPLASINVWVVPEDQDRLEPSYEAALFGELDRLLDAVPQHDLAIQWDVAAEVAILEGGVERTASQGFDAIVERLVRCVQRVPPEVPVGLHLCYGDYQHRHFMPPASLELQVRLANAVTAGASRSVDWLAFTVPQDRDDASYFEPLAQLDVPSATELYFALVPYHPDDQPAGVPEAQAQLVERHIGEREWGICTECGMGRVDRADVPNLLDLHRELLATLAA
ncbi:MAG: hypothetical protein KY460_14025 [Actinobacteria bacterium]|nr:hypothetical protein [Actinomycetota bacterium]